MNNKEHILEKINQIVPDECGVYLWKNKNNEIIYVGKAKNLRKRLKQYFEGHNNSWLTPVMVDQINDFDFYICKSERDSFLTELKFIKQFQPRYNIKLTNKNTYPYFLFVIDKNGLHIDIGDNLNKKNLKYYFGPLTPTSQFSAFYDVLCNQFLYYKGLKITNKDESYWLNALEEIKNIFKNKSPEFIKLIAKKEAEYSSKLEFEFAQVYKNASVFIKSLLQTQILQISNTQSLDFFAFEKVNQNIFISIRSYQHGSTTYIENINRKFQGLLTEFIEKFINDYYKKRPDIISKILLDFVYKSENLIFDDNLTKRILYPQKGIYKSILENLKSNAQIQAKEYARKHIIKDNVALWIKLKQELNLSEIDKFIIFDNSFENYQKDVAGSSLCFDITGQIKNLTTFNKLSEFNQKIDKHSDVQFTYYNAVSFLQKHKNKINANDVFIADGGIAQINEIKEALKNFNLNNLVFGLVKNDNHKTQKLINDLGKTIQLSDESFLYFSALQEHVDKNVKRYYHQLADSKNTLKGSLNIPNIGKKTITALIAKFGTYASIKEQSLENLTEVIGTSRAQSVYNYFHKK
ncbi:GIY-YIG nuclease family protein [Mycoplasma sp. 5912]